jgi:hypothetical protein
VLGGMISSAGSLVWKSFPLGENSEAGHDVRRWTAAVVVELLTEGLRLTPSPTDKVSGSLAPALPFSSIFRFQKAARDDILGFLTTWAELGGVARFESRLFTAYLLTAPEAVQHILQDNNKKLLQGSALSSCPSSHNG